MNDTTDNYRTCLTTAGLGAIRDALREGRALALNSAVLSHRAAAPDEDVTEIADEVWRGAISALEVDADNPHWLVATIALPDEVGGFWIRSFGLLDDAGRVLVCGTIPDIYKPAPTSGAAKAVTLRIVFLVSNAQEAAVFRCESTMAVAMRDALARARAQILTDAQLTGTPTAPTPPEDDASTRLATTAFCAQTFSAARAQLDERVQELGDSVAASLSALEAQRDALAALDSPALTGAPTTSQPPDNDASTRIATTAFVKRALAATPINDIGTPGQIGFGVGICPELPDGFTALDGFDDPYSIHYGNYTDPSGSLMVWIPAFYYRAGDGNLVHANCIQIRSIASYPDPQRAARDGFALHRAFWDDGRIQPGFFIDKYFAARGPAAIAIAQPGLQPLTCHVHGTANASTLSGLTGLGASHCCAAGVFAAAHTRGDGFHVASGFQLSALNMLAMALGGVASKAICAWSDGNNNFPKGCTKTTLVDSLDNNVTYSASELAYVPLTGARTGFAKTTHNGQACGVADVSGFLYAIAPAITAQNNTYYILRETVRMASLEASDYFNTNVSETLFDALGATFMGLRASTTRYGTENTGTVSRIAPATGGLEWAATGAGVIRAEALTNTTTYANAMHHNIASGRSNSAISVYGGDASAANTGRAGALSTNETKDTTGNYGFRVARYL